MCVRLAERIRGRAVYVKICSIADHPWSWHQHAECGKPHHALAESRSFAGLTWGYFKKALQSALCLSEDEGDASVHLAGEVGRCYLGARHG